jgi:hypothetical protein
MVCSNRTNYKSNRKYFDNNILNMFKKQVNFNLIEKYLYLLKFMH